MSERVEVSQPQDSLAGGREPVRQPAARPGGWVPVWTARAARTGTWHGALENLWRENRQFLFLLGCIVFFKSAVADVSSISGSSMQPTLLDGDKVWVNKIAYDLKVPFTGISLAEMDEPQRGDVVIIDSSKAGKRLIKRIVGIPGDTVAMRDNTLVINGEAVAYQVLDELGSSFIVREELPEATHRARVSRHPFASSPRSFAPLEVPAGHFFVLGDNRDVSRDSRSYSFFTRAEIVGRSDSVLFSLDSGNSYLPRGDRFLAAIR